MFEAAQSSYAKGDFTSAWASARRIERLFLYSKFSTEDEMLVDDIDFDLRSFERAATEYDAFAIHHPRNPETARARQKAEEARATLRSTPTRAPKLE